MNFIKLNIMNLIKIFIFLLGFTILLTSCQEDWLDREPLDQVTEASFFLNANDFTVFVNRFHTSTGGSSAGWGDYHTDVLISRVSIPVRIGGVATINSGPGYNYGNIRQVNYLLEQARKWEGEFEDIKQAVGEAHYFRAYYY